MAPNRKINKKIFKSLFWIYFIASVVTFFFLYQRNESQQDYFESQINYKAKSLDSLSLIMDAQNKVLNADNAFILGNYDTAAALYGRFSTELDTAFFNDLISLRINRINEITNNRDTLFQDLKTFQFLLNNSNKKLDSLNTQLMNQENEIKESKEKYVAENEILRNQLAEKQAELNKKDKVSVISFRNEKGNLVHYLGEVKEGMANGGGVGIFDTGGIYKGEWKNNQRHGKGLYEWKDGHKYDGEFVNGERQGQGTYTWASGEKYTGEWKDGKRNGQGTLYDKDNNISYQGLWVDDKVKK